MSYKERQLRVRQKAIEWQLDFHNHNYDMSELIYWYNYFLKLGNRYGLTKEFRENGVL